MKKNAGFSLIEMMVVLAASSALTVATTAAFLTMSNGVKNSATKSDAQSVVKDISQVTLMSDNCLKAVAGQAFHPKSDNTMDLSIDVTGRTIAAGTVLVGESLVVKSLQLKYIRNLNMNGVNGNPLWTGDMFVEVQLTDPAAKPLRPQRAGRLYFEVNGTTIVSCSSKREMQDVLAVTCAQMHGVYSSASGKCDMAPYANAVGTLAESQISTQLQYEFRPVVMQQLNSNIEYAMAETYKRGVAATAANTETVMARVNTNLINNLGQIQGRTTDLQNSIRNNVAQIAQGNSASRANANAIYQSALNAYGAAMNAYNESVAAVNNANANLNYANVAANTAGSSYSYGFSARQNAVQISNAALDAMNQATQAVNTANGANATANSVSYQASVARDVANAANSAAYSSQANSINANNAAGNSVNYAGSAQNNANNAVNNANAAANAASYAAGAANGAKAYADYALANPPRVNNVDYHAVIFQPVVVNSCDCPDTVYDDPDGPIANLSSQNSQISKTVYFQSAVDRIKPGCKYKSITIQLRHAGLNYGQCSDYGEMPNLYEGGPAGSAGFINGGGSGNKTSYATAVVGGTQTYITDATGGWGDAAGNNRSACLSNIKIIVHSEGPNCGGAGPQGGAWTLISGGEYNATSTADQVGPCQGQPGVSAYGPAGVACSDRGKTCAYFTGNLIGGYALTYYQCK